MYGFFFTDFLLSVKLKYMYMCISLFVVKSLQLVEHCNISTQGHFSWKTYRKASNIRHTQSQNLKVSQLVLPMSLPNPLKPDFESRRKM